MAVTSVDAAFTKRQRNLLIDSAMDSPHMGQLLVFIGTATARERHDLGAERAYSLRLNGKPFSHKGPKQGSIRTRRLLVTPDLDSLSGQLYNIARFVQETPGLYGVNVLLLTSGAQQDADPDDKLTPEEVERFMAALPEGTSGIPVLRRIDVARWGRHAYLAR